LEGKILVSLQLIQIGMNTSDMAASLELFSEAFGFRNAGGQVILGELIQIQGLGPDSHAMMWWLVGAQDRFQLEFFHHSRPRQRALPADWSPADHGWSRFGVAVDGFDHAVAELAKREIAPIAGIYLRNGLRRCAYRDPFLGVVVEVMEDGIALRERSGRQAGPALVYATSSVSDLSAARTFYGEVLRLPIAEGLKLHDEGDDASWGLIGTKSQSFIVDAGGVLLEIIEYTQPRGRPRRTDYRFSDQGVVNVAFGAKDKTPIEAAFSRLDAVGLRPPYKVEFGDLLAGYILEAEREIELAVIPEDLEAQLGFVASMPFLGAST
jgi:catechol 2,3-dioxygenase-like lactoylglutathione lyase family enzyme